MIQLTRVTNFFIVICGLVILSSCSLFTDNSPRGLQQRWLVWVRDGAMGKNIYNCKSAEVKKQPCDISHGGYKPLSTKTLPNGNMEDEYEFRRAPNRCLYFYEYEVDTGRIVGFRYEETRLYGCRVTGA